MSRQTMPDGAGCQSQRAKRDSLAIVCRLITDHRGKARWAWSQANNLRDVPKHSQKREERVPPWLLHTQRPTEDVNLEGICKESRKVDENETIRLSPESAPNAKNLAMVVRWLWINKKPVRGMCHTGHTQVPAHFHSQAHNVCCD
jgi:hypothetical protein